MQNQHLGQDRCCVFPPPPTENIIFLYCSLTRYSMDMKPGLWHQYWPLQAREAMLPHQTQSIAQPFLRIISYKKPLFPNSLVLGVILWKKLPMGQEKTIRWRPQISFLFFGFQTSQPWRLLIFQRLGVDDFILVVIAAAVLSRTRLSPMQSSST